ncbi:MAG: 1-acyl-sn-glycerol-3-phosphate acyltransferase [Thermoanaerobaculia bacterium]|nr:1-acyl-sn-glycerol-3-phosphate acyltransferase [Thermoanaerobaculia bacterium]
MTRILSNLLWFPINLVQGLLACLWTSACITLALLVRVATGSTERSLGMARWLWAPGMLLLGGLRCEARGLDDVDWTKPYFIASNHQSYLDIILLFRVLPVNLHFVVKQELSKIPFLAWYIRSMGMIFVDRGSGKKAAASVKRTARLVAGGKHVLIFPEGTRSKDGSVGRLKSGVLGIAAAGSIPVVPVAVDGPGKLMPPNTMRYRPGTLKVNVGQPIPTDGYASDERRRLSHDVRAEIVRLLDELRSE